ncbi:MAG: LysR family transcriptional regulator [Eubacteriales bacterium]|nr:LysR family transcriptional regulator [Eubacteriales bacterium]
MKFQQLRYFIEVARKQSISAAAAELFISQPSLSQQIMSLEKELDVPLLIRHSKSVSLTNAGEQFLVHAQRIVGEAQQLEELMHKHKLLQAGTIHLGMLWIAGYLNLFQIMQDYQKRFPGISFDLKIDGSARLLEKLLKREIHCAFILGTDEQLEQHKDLFFRKIMSDRYVAVASSNDPIAAGDPISLKELNGRRVIMPSTASAFYNELSLWFERYHITPQAVCETSQSDTVIRLAEAGFGIGFSSESIARSLKTRNFSIIQLKEQMIRNIYYVSLKELLDYPSVRSFTRFVTHYSFPES